MHGLDRKTHIYVIESISGTRHIKLAMQKRFINFLKRITESEKVAMKVLYDTVKLDCQSTLGRNLRRIMLDYGLTSINDITTETIKTKQYAEIPENESWRVPLVKEIVSIKNGPYEVPNLTANEISEILDFAATS